MSQRVAIIGGRPPKKSSCTYEQDLVKYQEICHAVAEYVASLPDGTVVVSGGAQGVDSVAAACARARELEVVEHLPDYANYTAKMAPLVRNTLIVEDSDEVMAFPAPWSTGTWHAIGIARDKEKSVCVRKI